MIKMEIRPWLPSDKQRQLFYIVADLLDGNNEIILSKKDNPKLDAYINSLSSIFPLESVRLNRISDRVFSDGSVIYLPLGDGNINGRSFKSGSLIICRKPQTSTFTSTQDFYLLSFLSISLETLAPELLTHIGSFLPNDDLRNMIRTSRATTYIDPNAVERKLRQCNVYGQPVEYWETFIEIGSPFVECYQYFIEKGVKPDDGNYMALTLAAANGWLDVVEYLVSKGANIHVRNNYALKSSVRRGNLDVVKYLISQGAQVEHYLLVLAVQNNDLEMVRYLISLGLDLNYEDGSVLKEAVSKGYLDIVELLVSSGADLHIADDDIILLAAWNGHLEVVKYLALAGANTEVLTEEAFRKRYQPAQDRALEYLRSSGILS